MTTRPLWLGDHLVSVVIPTRNEARNLPLVLPRIPAWVHEVVIVDGHSTDGTLEVARECWSEGLVIDHDGTKAPTEPSLAQPRLSLAQFQALPQAQSLAQPPIDGSDGPLLRLVTQEGSGKGSALRTGFAIATGDIIVMLDADGSTLPEELPEYVRTLIDGADFVKGSRFLRGGGTSDMPLYRKLGNGAFVLLVRLLFGGRYTDLCYGYSAFWKRVLPFLKLDGTGFEIETMMNVRALQAGLNVQEVPSFEKERVYGQSNLQTFPDGWRVLSTILRERLKPAAQPASKEPVPFPDAAATTESRLSGPSSRLAS